MAASGSGGESRRTWTATSTWAPAGGAAVEDTVSFETSDDDAETAPSAVVLARPPPTETAIPLPARLLLISGESTRFIGCMCEAQLGFMKYNVQLTRRVPGRTIYALCAVDLLLKNRCAQAHYEASVEITDASPCVSLTVHLLSLQSKPSVHIEEIYIFADPVESTNDDSVAGPGNMGGSSLLAMLVPGLMQMSKSRNLKIDDRYFSDGSRTQLPEGCAMKESSPCEKIAQETGPYGTNDSKFKSAGMESRLQPTDGGTISNEKTTKMSSH